MTNEEAIEILSDVGDINRCCAEDAEALDMAIKALEQQPCEDCISREAVLEVQIKYAEHMGATKYWQIRDDIRALSPVTPKTRWIPCKERLPEDDGWYLCTIQNETETKVAEIRFFEDTKWKAYGWNVIAWMNEPQPYKAESEDKE